MQSTGGAAQRIERVLRCAFCVLLIGSSSCARSSNPVIHLDTTGRAEQYNIEVTGLSGRDLSALSRANLTADEWNDLLRVTVRSPEPAAEGKGPAMAGRYTVDDSLRFWPSYPFDSGREYDVRFDSSRVPRAGLSAGTATATVSIPATHRSPSARVTGVYPGSDIIPENLLRMYVVFSEPMGQQGGKDHITFVDDNGREVPDVVVPLDTDLWNAERTRYTVILDPGRVKREILPNRQMGRALHGGAGITIMIKHEWPDAHCLPMTSDYRRRYQIGPAEEHALSTASWHVTAPPAGSRDRVTVTFPKPLDYALLQRSLSVRRGDSNIPGDVRIGPGEAGWDFMPRDEWERGPYMLKVDPILEDVAGNRIGRAFEVLSRGDAVPAESSVPVLVPFIVK